MPVTLRCRECGLVVQYGPFHTHGRSIRLGCYFYCTECGTNYEMVEYNSKALEHNIFTEEDKRPVLPGPANEYRISSCGKPAFSTEEKLLPFMSTPGYSEISTIPKEEFNTAEMACCHCGTVGKYLSGHAEEDGELSCPHCRGTDMEEMRWMT